MAAAANSAVAARNGYDDLTTAVLVKHQFLLEEYCAQLIKQVEHLNRTPQSSS